MARGGIDKKSWVLIGIFVAVGVINLVLAVIMLFPKPYTMSWGEEIDRRETYLRVEGKTFTQDDLEAVASIRTLKSLTLKDCNVAECRLPDLRFASRGLYELELVNVKGLWDLSFLSNVPVEYLTLRDCTQVDDLSTINLDELTELDISGTSVSDLSPLAGSKIWTLSFARTKVSDISPLAEMRSLRHVDGSDTQASSLDAVMGIDMPSGLDFAGCPIEKLPDDLDLTYTYELDLSRTKIRDFSVLGDCRGFTRLDLAGNPQLEDMSWLDDESLASLKRLNLAGTGLEKDDLAFLRKCPHLEELYLDGIALGDLTAIGELRELTYLSAVGCDLEDVSGIKRLPEIETLLLGYNHITDLSGLPAPNDEWAEMVLDLSHNGLTSLKGLPAGAYRLLLLQGNDIDYATTLSPKIDSYMIIASWNDSVEKSALSEYGCFSVLYVPDYPEDRGGVAPDGFSSYQFVRTNPDQVLYALLNDGFDYSLYTDFEWYVAYAASQGDGNAENGEPFEDR